MGVQVVKDSLTLHRIASRLRKRRFDSGALRWGLGSGPAAPRCWLCCQFRPCSGAPCCLVVTGVLHLYRLCRRLDNTRLYFKLDGEGNPQDYGVYEQAGTCLVAVPMSCAFLSLIYVLAQLLIHGCYDHLHLALSNYTGHALQPPSHRRSPPLHHCRSARPTSWWRSLCCLPT